MPTLRDLVTEDEGGLFRPEPDHLDLLAYYASAVQHLAVGDGAGSPAAAASHSATVPA